MSEDKAKKIIKQNKEKLEREDVPVNIGDKTVSTDPKLVRSIQLGETDENTTEMISKKKDKEK